MTNLSRLGQSLHVLQQHCMKTVRLHKFFVLAGAFDGFLGVDQSLHCFARKDEKGSEKTRGKECPNSELDDIKLPMSQRVCKHTGKDGEITTRTKGLRVIQTFHDNRTDREETRLTWLMMVMQNKSHTTPPNWEMEARQWTSSSIRQRTHFPSSMTYPTFSPQADVTNFPSN